MTDEIDKAIDDAFRCSACGRIEVPRDDPIRKRWEDEL